MSDRMTLATSTGLPFLALAFHIATGMLALVAGYIAIAVRKGGTWHRRSGLVFAYAMIATGLTAAGLSVYEGKTVGGGALTAYLVFTALTAVKPVPGASRRVDIALMVLALTLAATTYWAALTAFGRPGHQLGGVPAVMLLFLATVALLAAVGDARMIIAGGVHGTRRLARHLWRMSFGLYIAAGSFFFGQLPRMTFVPEWLRSMPVLVTFGVGPLVLLLYWMWRVRLRRNLRGMLTAQPIEARRPT